MPENWDWNENEKTTSDYDRTLKVIDSLEALYTHIDVETQVPAYISGKVENKLKVDRQRKDIQTKINPTQ